MQVSFTENGTVLTGAVLNIQKTFECGQCFRFIPDGDGYSGVAFGRALHVTQDGDAVLLYGVRQPEYEEIWARYFDLDRDYDALSAAFCNDETLRTAYTFSRGIRILSQDPWETLCSFILSQNNNIPRIMGIVDRLCENFGEPLPGGGFSFPEPERLMDLSAEDLAPLRCGFRARYVLDAARRVGSGELPLNEIAALPLPEAREALQVIDGVGPKVAECALLYGMHRLDAFPLDVWMRRAMQTLFPGKSPDFFGPYAGIAQQYVFHYSRLHPELFG